MELAFMPWAGIEEQLVVGGIQFYSYDEKSIASAEPSSREFIQRYLGAYVDHDGAPIDTVTLCSVGKFEFRDLTEPERVRIRRAVDALILAVIGRATNVAVSQDNSSLAPPNTERYQLLFQTFDPTKRFVAVRSGNMLHAWNLDAVRFAKPWSTGGEPLFGFDAPTIRGLSKLLVSTPLDNESERIFRALEWFRFAHVGTDDVSATAKIVMMGTAFEILFGSSGINEKFAALANKLDEYLVDEDLRRWAAKAGQPEYSAARWWLYDFYRLRSAITHGDAISIDRLRYESPNHDWLTHAIVADLVFWECVLWNLFDLALIGAGARATASDFAKLGGRETSEDSFVRHVARSHFGFDQYQKSIGWTKDEGNSDDEDDEDGDDDGEKFE